MFNQSLRLMQKKIGCLARELRVFDVRCISYVQLFFKVASNTSSELSINGNSFVNLNARYYAKSRDIKKEKKREVKIDEIELQEYFDVEKLLTDFKKPLENFNEDLVKHATLRTSPNVIENIKINFEGNTYTICDLAEVSKKNPRFYVLDFSSFPAVIPTVIKTLQNTELNLNVQQDGTKVFVPLPKVTKEHREVLAKKCSVYFHKCKESIRNVRIKYEKSLNGIERLPIEKKFRITDQLTALGDKHIFLAEKVLKAKHEELLRNDEVV